jgi:hypothetical protein
MKKILYFIDIAILYFLEIKIRNKFDRELSLKIDSIRSKIEGQNYEPNT